MEAATATAAAPSAAAAAAPGTGGRQNRRRWGRRRRRGRGRRGRRRAAEGAARRRRRRPIAGGLKSGHLFFGGLSSSPRLYLLGFNGSGPESVKLLPGFDSLAHKYHDFIKDPGLCSLFVLRSNFKILLVHSYALKLAFYFIKISIFYLIYNLKMTRHEGSDMLIKFDA